jgi:hypothetical protein
MVGVTEFLDGCPHQKYRCNSVATLIGREAAPQILMQSLLLILRKESNYFSTFANSRPSIKLFKERRKRLSLAHHDLPLSMI